ncbi:MAG: hypothetical protein EZS28_006423 [Streblomastix strix]|uniref:Uncharacterized protein n=1 Tax=Streblomastix strix TaxID=222440 RepID=A0A5J4WTC8_9EUKA|nr:MAG: hypothetical protein EZS28_006423 [Streblomastix strix]
MISPEKPDIVYLVQKPTEDAIFNYKKFNPYEALAQTANGQMFDCFADQDVVSAPSDLYHSFTFENLNYSDKGCGFYGRSDVNVFAKTILFQATKVTKTLYPNKYMLAWKLTTDDSFMRGQNSSKLVARTNTQVIQNGNLTKGVLESTDINKDQNQNDLKQFIAMRYYPDITKASIIPMLHYLCDAFMRITFDNNRDPQVLNIDVRRYYWRNWHHFQKSQINDQISPELVIMIIGILHLSQNVHCFQRMKMTIGKDPLQLVEYDIP